MKRKWSHEPPIVEQISEHHPFLQKVAENIWKHWSKPIIHNTNMTTLDKLYNGLIESIQEENDMIRVYIISHSRTKELIGFCLVEIKESPFNLDDSFYNLFFYFGEISPKGIWNRFI